jgi:hypothetical protein
MAQRTFAISRRAGSLALLAGLLVALAAAAPALAQSPLIEPRWLPWLGCWAPSSATPTEIAELTGVERVCVFPDEAAGVRIASITDDRISTRDAIPETGFQRSVSRDGCVGWQRASWGRTGKRLYRRTELFCDGGYRQVSTGMFVMLSAAEWAEIEATEAGGQQVVTIVRYREAADTTDAVRVVIGSLAGRSVAMRSARMSASAVPTVDEVIEAANQVDPSVVEAWLVHRRPGLEVTARDLRRMADAGVAPQVIDVMVELSHPAVAGGRLGSGNYAVTRFPPTRDVVTAIPLAPSEAATVFAQEGTTAIAGQPATINNYYYSYGFDQFGFNPYSYYGMYPYGGFGIIYRTGLFAFPRHLTGFPDRHCAPFCRHDRDRDDRRPDPGRGRVIVITPPRREAPSTPPPPAEPAPPPGRAVNGRGYTRYVPGSGTAVPSGGRVGQQAAPPASTDAGSGRSVRSRGTVVAPPPRATGNGSNGGSGSARAGSGGGSTTRTAVPRGGQARQTPPPAQAAPPPRAQGAPPARAQASTANGSTKSSSQGSAQASSSSGRTAKLRPPAGK